MDDARVPQTAKEESTQQGKYSKAYKLVQAREMVLVAIAVGVPKEVILPPLLVSFSFSW
jgi:hypothetical protein